MQRYLTKKELEENKRFSSIIKAKEFTDYLYGAYGSGTGVLFGIPSDCRDAVYYYKVSNGKTRKGNKRIKK